MNADAVIVGGGVAGLACATALADLGLRAVVLEEAERLGGRAASDVDPTTGDAIDIGPHVLTSEHRNFCALLRRVGTARKVLWQPEPMLTLFDAGKRLPLHSWPLLPPLQGLPNLRQVLRSIGMADLASNWRVVWTAARLDEPELLRLDAIDALSFLKRLGVTQRFVEWYWTPVALSLLNVPLARCSTAALMRLFRLMIGRSGYHFGFPKVGLSELFVPGCRRTVEAAGGMVATGCAVRELVLRDGRFEAAVLADGRRVAARCAVLAVPPLALAKLAPPAWHDADTLPATAAQRFEPCPYISTMLWFDRPLTRDRFWARVWRPGDLNLDFYDLSNIRDGAAGGPATIASNAIHAHDAWDWSDERIVDRTHAEIAEFAPAAARARVRHAVVHRIPMAIACPLPGTETLRPSLRTPFHNLWIAGDWTRTGLPSSMESAARSGGLAAEAVAAHFGRHRAIAKPPPDTKGLVALLS